MSYEDAYYEILNEQLQEARAKSGWDTGGCGKVCIAVLAILIEDYDGFKRAVALFMNARYREVVEILAKYIGEKEAEEIVNRLRT